MKCHGGRATGLLLILYCRHEAFTKQSSSSSSSRGRGLYGEYLVLVLGLIQCRIAYGKEGMVWCSMVQQNEMNTTSQCGRRHEWMRMEAGVQSALVRRATETYLYLYTYIHTYMCIYVYLHICIYDMRIITLFTVLYCIVRQTVDWPLSAEEASDRYLAGLSYARKYFWTKRQNDENTRNTKIRIHKITELRNYGQIPYCINSKLVSKRKVR